MKSVKLMSADATCGIIDKKIALETCCNQIQTTISIDRLENAIRFLKTLGYSNCDYVDISIMRQETTEDYIADEMTDGILILSPIDEVYGYVITPCTKDARENFVLDRQILRDECDSNENP